MFMGVMITHTHKDETLLNKGQPHYSFPGPQTQRRNDVAIEKHTAALPTFCC